MCPAKEQCWQIWKNAVKIAEYQYPSRKNTLLSSKDHKCLFSSQAKVYSRAHTNFTFVSFVNPALGCLLTKYLRRVLEYEKAYFEGSPTEGLSLKVKLDFHSSGPKTKLGLVRSLHVVLGPFTHFIKHLFLMMVDINVRVSIQLNRLRKLDRIPINTHTVDCKLSNLRLSTGRLLDMNSHMGKWKKWWWYMLGTQLVEYL